MDNPKLSIIVPMYNSEKTISDCIDSILKQTFRQFELILVDDGSQDDTLNICQVYAKKDSRIILIHLNNTNGSNYARKIGVKIAKSELIGFVDSDDFVERDMYSSLMKVQAMDDCDLVSSGIYRDYIDEKYTIELLDNFQEGIYCDLPKEIYPTMLFDDEAGTFGIFCTLVNKLYKREILESVYENIDTRVFYGEDCLTLFSYIMKISNIYILRKSFYHYNIRKNSICSTKNQSLINNTYYLFEGLKKAFSTKTEYKYILQRQLKKYILGIELNTLDKLYNISPFTLGTYKYSYNNLNNNKVVLYGAGNSSESLYKYLVEKCKCNVVAWVDKYPLDKDMKVLHEILPVKSIINMDYDYIVIAVMNEKLAMSIKRELVELYDLDERKIIWEKVEYSNLIKKIY